MAFTFFVLLASAALLLILYLVKKYTYWQRRGIPTIKGTLPLIGNLLPVLTLRKNFGDFHTTMYREYNKHSMVGYYKLLHPVLLIREPELIKTVLQSNFSNFHKNGMTIRKDLDPLLSRNPFFNYGEAWSRSRKRMTYAFSNVRLKTLFLTVQGVCKKFGDFLTRRLATDDKYEVELKYLFSKFTGEVVANAGLGIEGYCFEDKKHHAAFDLISDTVFSTTITRAIVTTAMFLPEIRDLFRTRFIPKEFDQFFRNVVKENMDIRRKESVTRPDYLQLMMDLSKSANEEMDQEAIAAEALSFYVDGYETSSITLSFVGYHLATHPDVQDKLRQEVRSTIAKYDGVLTFEGLKEMTYLDRVISESQRIYPVLGSLTKKCTNTITLQGSDGLTCKVEPGTEIIIPLQALHMDPDYWPDPEVYDPERFNENRKQSVVKMTFLAFGEGPRMCVGMKMALLQMKASLATLINKYKIESSPKMKLPLKMSPYYFMLSPEGGLWVNISKI